MLGGIISDGLIREWNRVDKEEVSICSIKCTSFSEFTLAPFTHKRISFSHNVIIEY